VRVGGARAEGFPTDLYYELTVADGVAPDALMFREESFGPVLPITTFADDDEALRHGLDGQQAGGVDDQRIVRSTRDRLGATGFDQGGVGVLERGVRPGRRERPLRPCGHPRRVRLKPTCGRFGRLRHEVGTVIAHIRDRSAAMLEG